MKTLFITLLVISFKLLLYSQYAPGVGKLGTTAISADSSVFQAWATHCKVNLGLMNIANPSLGYVYNGDTTKPIGKADNATLSLGDGGIATLTFKNPITNGAGYDFAVFENSFDDSFLELAFVEVSSDGINFYRFNSISLTDTMVQTGTFGLTDPTKINNLAGKYRGGYGTPFDLDELKNIDGLNINKITHIRIIDVVGSLLEAYATYDSNKNKINDPWPTPFFSGGFDLDAVGVIHVYQPSAIESIENHSIKIYPNPAMNTIHILSDKEINQVEIYSSMGELLKTITNQSMDSMLDLSFIDSGIYYIRFIDDQKSELVKLVKIE